MILSYAAALFSFNFRFRIKEDVGKQPRKVAESEEKKV